MKNVIEFLIKAIDQASPEFKDIADEAGKSAKKIEYDYDKLSLASTAAFAALAYGIKDATDESTELGNALLGLSSIAEGNGVSITQAKEAAMALADDGLMPVADAATGLKNLLSRGFGLQESIDIMNRFKDSAAFGRQASLGFGEAIKGATEGLKNENSVLVNEICPIRRRLLVA